jgi:thiamine-phosphate pyrophosphorylase
MMLRLIDANLNRLSEGLRLLEDVSRFMLSDATLSARLKALRHRLSEGNPSIRTALLSARDSAEDVGAFAADTMQRRDVPDIVAANARRVTESLRVLEEFAKLPDSTLDPATFKEARFAMYDIERELTGKVLRRGRRIRGLYVIIDPEMLGQRDEVETCQQAIRGGAKVVQLRDKKRDKRDVLESARRLHDICRGADVPFIVNDYADIVISSAGDGLHLGQEDLPLPEARRILPIDKLIGCTTRTVEQAQRAEAEGADYVAVGAMYPTRSKEQPEVVGLERLRQVRESVSLPVVAIGGINADNAPDVIDAGADAVAVMSAVILADDVEKAARSIAEKVETT